MIDAEKSAKIELNEIMLAMDVVDTLRHQQSLVDRELGTDDHDQALLPRSVRSMPTRVWRFPTRLSPLA